MPDGPSMVDAPSPRDAPSPPPELLGDIPPDVLRTYLHRVADWVADYRGTIEQRAITSPVRPGEVAARCSAEPPREPAPLDEILADLETVVMPGIVHWGHPAFLGYFGSTSNGPALLGEIVAAALNVSAMTWRTSPAATELETLVLRWIRQMIGLPESFTGVVYDTASVGVLHALAAAREMCGVDVRERGLAGHTDMPVFRVYASDQAHSSIDKAMIVLGLGESNVVRVPSDAAFRLDVAALRAAMEADARAGFRAMAVVATIGTTSTTSVDPVAEIAAVCREHGAWLHVDAAYGGALAVLPEGKWAMTGAELADSVVVNPHKWMFVPLDFSALYTRHPDVLRAVFSLTPEYLRGDSAAGSATTGGAGDVGNASKVDNAGSAAGGAGHRIDYMDYSLQLGRRFRSLKAWMMFRAFGRDGIAARIREQCRLAQQWARWVDADPLFVRAAPVPMAVVCFRCVPAGLDDQACDRLNEAIVEAVNASGKAYLTHTRVGGRVVMRIGIGNVLTTERELERAWGCVRGEAAAIASMANAFQGRMTPPSPS
ncbi:MAG TPA: pyridoxal-dependent decarboxylase [Gemmatimonadaceae bacterium]|nr:pyridoxal-dependent decarboxylase [Gemmatimonadaceae bacterium]